MLRFGFHSRVIPESSAGFQPAVSPISNRLTVQITTAVTKFTRPAGWKPATQQAGNLSYDSILACLVFLLLIAHGAHAQHQLASGQQKSEPFVAPASKEGELAIK